MVGPGAIGGTVATWLAQDPSLAVTVCARTAFEGLEVQTPDGPITAAPVILTDPAQAAPVDWVLIATKAYDVEGAATWLPRLLRPDTRVAVLQNGVEHVARFAPWLPPERVVPAVVNIPAERLAPGRFLQRRNGSIVVPDGPPGAAFTELFVNTPIEVSTTPDWLSVAWAKLCLNSAGAVFALTLQPARVAARPAIAELMRALAAEGVSVGRAEGADLADDLPDQVIENYRAAAPDSINSILADRLAGRPMEVDLRNGVIVRLGRKHGVPTPVNALAVVLLDATA